MHLCYLWVHAAASYQCYSSGLPKQPAARTHHAVCTAKPNWYVLMHLFNKIHLSRFKFNVHLNSVFCLEGHEACIWLDVPKWGAAAAPAVLLELCTD